MDGHVRCQNYAQLFTGPTAAQDCQNKATQLVDSGFSDYANCTNESDGVLVRGYLTL